MKHKQTFIPRMSIVAMALAQAFATQAMAQQADASTVVVTGIRASAQSSLAIKRDTMEVVDSITAQDIGKLPDPNVSETLTRVPGVQGYRYGGEGASPVGTGSGLTIRGLSGQTGSQVNGRSYFTAGGREFNIEGAIPGMVAGVDVYKNPSAEHIEGAIGGLVNIRTRNPSDFKELTGTLSIGGRYDDLEKKTDPEVFGMVANRWNLSGGGRIGVMAAAVYQKSTGRSDNNPANGDPNLKRAVRADSTEYATLAKANGANNPASPMAQYVGRSDVWYLANVPLRAASAGVGANTPDLTGLTPDQISNVMLGTAVSNNVFEETIKRERRGLNLAADWRVDNTLRFYADSLYTYYQYHQEYRGLNSVDGSNVQNLQTTPFNYTEGLANRNINGGSDDVLVSKRLQGATFLNSTVTTNGGDEHRPYSTWVAAAGAEWSPTPALKLKADFSYVKANQSQDNRNVTMNSAPGLFWSTTRFADGAPHQLTFAGPSLSDPKNFVLGLYSNGTNQTYHDTGNALALDGSYSLEEGLFLSRLKFGTRFAKHDSHFRNYSFSNRPLTADGQAANAGNLVSAGSGNYTETAPTNFMYGETGYSGGYVVYAPQNLLGDQVRTAFPNAGIRPEGSLAENLTQRRDFSEKTKAFYVVGEFALLDERLKGSAGVRVVRTSTETTAYVNDTTSGTATVRALGRSSSYTNALPSFNVSYDLAKDFLARFAYGKGLTRPGIDQLNPTVSVNTTNGTGTIGNADLHPLTANSYDISLERYFSKTNYVAGALFDKEINGFFNSIVECQTVPTAPAYAGSIINGCAPGQYQMTKSVNAEKGYARGVELSGQYFFDSAPGWLRNFGVSGSYTYVKTANPVNFGTAAAPVIVSTPQAFQSKNNYSVTGMYEDDKLSMRLVYTWRSPQIFNALSVNPIGGRYIASYGLLDGSINYQLTEQMSLSLNASNITNKTLNRYVGEPGLYQTSLERQHYENGRTINLALRYKFGKL
jgi:TonB-dependent receptor